MPKKVCFVITSRAQYGRLKHLLDLVNKDPAFSLQFIIGGQALLHRYGEIVSELEANGFSQVDKLYTMIEGGDHMAMTKTTGLALMEFANSLQRFAPDLVILTGDRYEVLAASVAAAYLNKVIAHIEGGDLSGTIDESVRHAVTKFSHLHFVTNEMSYQRLLRMGENPMYVHNVGSLDIEYLNLVPTSRDLSQINVIGVGAKIDFSKPYLVVIQHPVTTEEDNYHQVTQTLQAVYESGYQAVWFWPNADAGTEASAKAIRVFRETTHDNQIRLIIHLQDQLFINLLRQCVCLVGNSSAGIKESSYLGVPVVNIGSRQNGRLRASNVRDVDHNVVEIRKAIAEQIQHGPYPASNIYYRPGTASRIVEIIKTVSPSVQKIFYDY